MPDDHVPYLIIIGGGLALWAVAAWASWLARRDLALAADDPTEPDELMALADAVAEDTCDVPDEEIAAWTPARPGDTPGELIPGEGEQVLPEPARYEPLIRHFLGCDEPCGHVWHNRVESIQHGDVRLVPAACDCDGGQAEAARTAHEARGGQ